MNYITVENISKSYGELNLFQNISFSIHKNQKIAFVAKNGTGKTSILNILAKIDTPDSGQVVYRKGIKTAFLTQEYLEERAKRGSREKFEKVLSKVPDVPPEEYDRL